MSSIMPDNPSGNEGPDGQVPSPPPSLLPASGDKGYNPDVVKGLLDFDIEPAVTPVADTLTETVLFRGKKVQTQPPSFEANRRSVVYVANSDPKVGERIRINDKEYRLTGRAIKNFLYYADIKGGAKYFLESFDVETRDDMVNQLLQGREARNFRWFYDITKDGPVVLNMLPDRRPVLADVEVLGRVEEIMSDKGLGTTLKNFTQTPDGLFIDLLTQRKLEVPNPKLGDAMSFGIRLKQSQLGWFSPEVEAYVYRLVCENGATALAPVIAWKADKGDGNEPITMNELPDWYDRAITHVFGNFEYIQDKTNEAATTKASPTIFMDIVRENKFGRAIVEQIDKSFEKEPGETIFHVANAITRAAWEGNFDFATRQRLEAVGGRLIWN